MKAHRGIIISTAAMLLLTACGTSDEPCADCDQPGSATTTSTPSPQEPTVSPSTTPLGDDLPTNAVAPEIIARSAVQAAVADLAAQREISTQDIQVVGHRTVTWADGSAGCPEPGQVYTQALVPGEQLLLQVGDELVNYHSANGGDFFWCASPVAPSDVEPVNPDL